MQPRDGVIGLMEATAHFTTSEPSTEEWVVTRNGTEVARSSAVQLVRETYQGRELDPVPYFPLTDISVELLGPSGHSTTCPVKGDAIYFAVDGDPETDNGIWSYADPISPLEAIAGYLAFYGDRFNVRRVN